MQEGSVVCFGEVIADFHCPEPGRLEEAHSFLLTPGGAPANVAVGLRRMGVPAAFVGKVGQDFLGRYLRGVLQTENVDTEFLLVSEEASTAQAFISRDSDGERHFEFLRAPGADSRLAPSDLSSAILQNASMLVFGSFSLSREPARSACFELVQSARRRELPVVFDPNIRPSVFSTDLECRRAVQRGVNVCDILKISEEELEYLQEGVDRDQALRNLLTHGPQVILLTLGSQGAQVYTRHCQVDCKAPRVEAIDTTGAGDAFLAGFLTAASVHKGLGWVRASAQIKKMVHLGCRVGALCVTRRGAMRALPTRDELMQAAH